MFFAGNSIESATAYWSVWDPSNDGGYQPRRDQNLQLLALQAFYEYWFMDTPSNNVMVGGVEMIQPAFCSIWNWDARPFPWFPNLSDVWGDTGNWQVGNWLSGKGLFIAPPVTFGGVPFLQAMHNGLLDGAEITRTRVFLNSWSPSDCANPIGGTILFKGRVGTVDSIGRTSAQVTVNSDLVLLDIQMPRNLYAPNCQHRLYDTGCGLIKSAHGTSGTVGPGSTAYAINWSGSSSAYAQGTITFSSGANAGVTANVKSATSSALSLSYALPGAPSTGGAFTAYQGCDHTQSTCQSKFGNLANFRGFPYVPPPTFAI